MSTETQRIGASSHRVQIEHEIEGLHERERELAEQIGHAVIAGAAIADLRAQRRNVRKRLEDLYAALGQLDDDRCAIAGRVG